CGATSRTGGFRIRCSRQGICRWPPPERLTRIVFVRNTQGPSGCVGEVGSGRFLDLRVRVTKVGFMRRNKTKASSPKKRTRKPAKTKAEQRAEMLEQILDAAEYLFSKHGLYGVTLRDVAQKIGVHTSLMHYYFEDKFSLFTQVFVRRANVT